MRDTICVILAGGQSSRMGRDKAALPLGGETFLQHLVGEYGKKLPVYVSLAREGQFDTYGAPALVDRQPGSGPLGGLEAAFLDTAAERVFLTATDLPFGTLALAEALLARLGGADACIIRRGDGQLEPAFGVYRRTCLGPLQDCLQEGRRSFRALLSRVTVQWVSEADLGEFPLERLLQNINTPEAYAENVVG